MTPAEEILAAARRKYDIATAAWRNQREIGGIVPLDPLIPRDNEDLAAGANYKCTTPAAVMVLGVWQKCNAELNAAAATVRSERGNRECPVCPLAPWAKQESTPDSRLPPERDEDDA